MSEQKYGAQQSPRCFLTERMEINSQCEIFDLCSKCGRPRRGREWTLPLLPCKVFNPSKFHLPRGNIWNKHSAPYVSLSHSYFIKCLLSSVKAIPATAFFWYSLYIAVGKACLTNRQIIVGLLETVLSRLFLSENVIQIHQCFYSSYSRKQIRIFCEHSTVYNSYL